jgi:hypothetical protein
MELIINVQIYEPKSWITTPKSYIPVSSWYTFLSHIT